MKRFATALFVLMAAVFTATWFVPPAAWVGYVRAFAEAAMVGALADWFAVTALFRHPLGLPIPHTAIIPRGKDQLGEALAAFVRRNFLTPEVLEPKLARIDYGLRAAEWLNREDNADRLARDAGALLVWLVDTIDNESLRRFVGDNLQVSLGRIQASPFIARILTMLTDEDRHQGLVDAAVRIAREQLDENRFRIRLRIGDRSPWWVPEFVDQEIYDKIVVELYRILDRVGSDPNHPARQRFNAATRELIEGMQKDPRLIARGEEIKQEILGHPSVQQYIAASWQQLREYVRSQVDEPESALNGRLRRGLQRLGGALAKDAQMRGQINAWVTSALTYSVEKYREQMSSVISDTVRAWDAEATSRRIELQVGRDLQFIRINGTLVGGLAGLVIYTVVHVFR